MSQHLSRLASKLGRPSLVVLLSLLLVAGGTVTASALEESADTTIQSSGEAAAAPGPTPAGFVPGRSVEDRSARARAAKTFLNPDGTHTTNLSSQPVHYWDGAAWQDIDNTVIPDQARPGVLRNRANSFVATFAPLAEGVGITAEGATITMKPAGTVSATAPVIDTDGSVVYQDAWPGVDLRYHLEPDGVKEDIVLRRLPAAASFRFAMSGAKVSARPDGGLDLDGPLSGKWVVAPPVVLDRSGAPVEAASPRLRVEDNGRAVAVEVSGGWLGGLTDADLPVVIDPTWRDLGGYQTITYNQFGGGCVCPPRVGRESNGTVWRTVVYFDYAFNNWYLADATILNSKIRLQNNEGYGGWTWIDLYQASGWGFNQSGQHLAHAEGDGAFDFIDNRLTSFYHNLLNDPARPWGAPVAFIGNEAGPFKQLPYHLLSLLWNRPPRDLQYVAPSPGNGTTTPGTSVTLAATASDPDDANGTLFYSHQLSLSSNFSSLIPTCGTQLNNGSCNVSGLVPNQTYYWRVTVYDGWPPVVYGPTWWFRTPVLPPGAPTNVVATPSDDGSATVTWSPPSSTGGGTIDQYAVNVFYASNGAWTGQQVVVCGTCTSATVTGLALDTPYYFGAYAHNSAGYGNPGLSNTITIPNVDPIGMVHDADGTRVWGWVHDPNGGGARTVNIYIADRFGIFPTTPTAAVTANLVQGDPPTPDGFEWLIPANLRDGAQHGVRVGAVDYPSGTERPIGNPTLSFAELPDGWTAANGSVWDVNKWTTSIGAGGGVSSAVDVQDGQGRLFVKGGDARAIAQTSTGSIASMRDADVRFTYRFDSRTASSTFRTILRGSGAWPLTSGYRFNVVSDSSTITVERVNAGSATALASFGYTKNTSAQRVRFRLEGGRLRLKVWPVGTAEPLDWQVDVIDASPLPGSGVLQFLHNVTKGNRSVMVDDLVLTSLHPVQAERDNAAGPPPASAALYIDTGANLDVMRTRGSEEGDRARLNNFDPLLVLDFGQQKDNLDGTIAFGALLTDAEISDVTMAFIEGFYATSGGKDVIVGVGTNNGGYDSEDDARRKGADWADLVRSILQRARAFRSGVGVFGANDFEAGFSVQQQPRAGAPHARAWVAGFDSGQVNIVTATFSANYGDASGCPENGPGNCNLGWTQDDYYVISGGVISAKGFPEIYNIPETGNFERDVDNADQWYWISRLGSERHQIVMDFAASLTQEGACTQPTRQGPCDPTTTATPAQGWSALHDRLAMDPRTKQPVGWASDIKWNSGCRGPCP